MNKLLFFASLLMLMFTSCTDSEDAKGMTDGEVAQQSEAITFEPYMARLSRATELTDLSALKTKGFGVFAYNQGNLDIEDYSKGNITPDFMFNTQVAWDNDHSVWTYNPVKYWPNNVGSQVSFFAYAPFMENIKSINGNPRLVLDSQRFTGPAIYYNAIPTDLDQCVDLCWGAEASTSSAYSPVNYVKTPAPGNTSNVSVSQKIRFNFKHALSRLKFNIQIFNDKMTDKAEHGNPAAGGSIADGTTITIKSLKLIGYISEHGFLSLYDGKWTTNFETRGLELLPYLEQRVFATNGAATEIDLFGADKYLTLIPGAQYKIQIEYYVDTPDEDHPQNSSHQKILILSDDQYTAEAGMATEFHLNLGMTTVKFDATVTDWVGSSQEIDLPNNLEPEPEPEP